MFIYQADTYCDSCGDSLIASLQAAKRLRDERIVDTGDSDDWPQSVFAGETDGPDHCARGVDCLEPLDLLDYGLKLSDPLYGAESTHIGALLSDGLTEYGVSYLREMLTEPHRTPYQRALYRYWREAFADELAA